MRVRCVRLIDPTTGQPVARDGWLSVGKEYVVLAVNASMGQAIELRLMNDVGTTPALFAADQFVTASTQVPSNWRASIDDGTYFRLAPASWLRAGFWEDYFNQVPVALEVFETEQRLIEAEDRRDRAAPTLYGDG